MIQEASWMLRYAGRSLRDTVRAWPRGLAGWKKFWASYLQYTRMAPSDRQPLVGFLYPCLGDDTAETPIEPTYFYQDAWAFEKIVRNRPVRHVDVGSHYKFVALLSKVVPVTMVDLRPLSLPLDSVAFEKGSILNLPFASRSVPSVSSLCVVEHIGLGRYGDPLDSFGSEQAIQELRRVVQPGGDLYVSVPLDDENRVYFNAHRAFREDYVLKLFEPFQVVERRYIYGKTFTDRLQPGFGIGCYHLKCRC